MKRLGALMESATVAYDVPDGSDVIPSFRSRYTMNTKVSKRDDRQNMLYEPIEFN